MAAPEGSDLGWAACDAVIDSPETLLFCEVGSHLTL